MARLSLAVGASAGEQVGRCMLLFRQRRHSSGDAAPGGRWTWPLRPSCARRGPSSLRGTWASCCCRSCHSCPRGLLPCEQPFAPSRGTQWTCEVGLSSPPVRGGGTLAQGGSRMSRGVSGLCIIGGRWRRALWRRLCLAVYLTGVASPSRHILLQGPEVCCEQRHPPHRGAPFSGER